jgi:hypothetical protein
MREINMKYMKAEKRLGLLVSNTTSIQKEYLFATIGDARRRFIAELTAQGSAFSGGTIE